jgi:hypothetical protein
VGADRVSKLAVINLAADLEILLYGSRGFGRQAGGWAKLENVEKTSQLKKLRILLSGRAEGDNPNLIEPKRVATIVLAL